MAKANSKTRKTVTTKAKARKQKLPMMLDAAVAVPVVETPEAKPTKLNRKAMLDVVWQRAAEGVANLPREQMVPAIKALTMADPSWSRLTNAEVASIYDAMPKA